MNLACLRTFSRTSLPESYEQRRFCPRARLTRRHGPLHTNAPGRRRMGRGAARGDEATGSQAPGFRAARAKSGVVGPTRNHRRRHRATDRALSRAPLHAAQGGHGRRARALALAIHADGLAYPSSGCKPKTTTGRRWRTQSCFSLEAERRWSSLPRAAEQARVSMAQRVLPAEVETLTAALADLLDAAPHGAPVAALLSRHYRQGQRPGDAFAGVVAELFAEEGLLVLDPRTPAMARLALPVLQRAIEEQDAIGSALDHAGGSPGEGRLHGASTDPARRLPGLLPPPGSQWPPLTGSNVRAAALLHPQG